MASELLLACIERVLAHAQPLRHLRNRIAPLSDLRDSIALELITEISGPHHGLLASNLGKKASTNLGAIHLMLREDADNLFFAEPVALHLWSFSMGQSLFQTGLAPRGNVNFLHHNGPG
jgi:hypothetical protein